MGMFEKFYSTKPKWHIVFGLILIFAGTHVVMAAEGSPGHLFSKGIDQIIGFIAIASGALYALIWQYVSHKKNNS